MRFTNLALMVIVSFATTTVVKAEPFQNLGIRWDDPKIVAWATSVSDFAPTSSGSELELQSNSLGPADGLFTSLGDLSANEILLGKTPGSILLSFSTPISNGSGWDFAVFENAGTFFEAPFVFAELSSVEVSSNGSEFAAFSIDSLNVEPGNGDVENELSTGFGRDFAGLNPNNVKNVAGIHEQGVGTAFDLNDLASNVNVISGDVNLDAIRFIRLTDIPGDGSHRDSHGRPILDAWPTGGNVGGFDLDAIGVRYLSACGSCVVVGDFNFDGALDIDDIEQLSHAIADDNKSSRFDLNGDDATNQLDLTYWVEVLANTYLGDTNLDGEFNSQDLIAVFQAGEYEDDLIGNSSWGSGDFNADREFDTTDMLGVFQSGGFGKGPRITALLVPEPSTPYASLGGTLAVIASIRSLVRRDRSKNKLLTLN